MGSVEGSAEAMGPDALMELLAIMGGVDGLVGAFFGSLGDLIGVGGGGGA